MSFDTFRETLQVNPLLTINWLSEGMGHFVYIMASRPGGALYTGRSGNLRQRVEAHRAGHCAHTAKYKIKRLVWFEQHDDFEMSLRRERAIKRWRRAWKIALVTDHNPNWHDLSAFIPEIY
ncbi:GIY-YIG nuclease family protein [Roseovarius sp. MMSF_3281]|uniref:GIY-YIG nuclease family protein n=1 Tax=Roseovarius sp. MMSF_3281 TaxID=3046694 RepID=UPI002740115B|nr:GIY-YIG nuclease family protein [Roseovarius sp. MMSF_3281]